MAFSQSAIIAELDQRATALSVWFSKRDDGTFCTGPAGRWTEGQQLDHLIRSVKPLNLALRLPRMVLRLKFGTAQAERGTLEAMAERYEAVLRDGAKASGRFVPPEIAMVDKPKRMAQFQEENERLRASVGAWSEGDLDKYLLPHPLLGKLTVREMLYFTCHHMGHHLETLQRDY